MIKSPILVFNPTHWKTSVCLWTMSNGHGDLVCLIFMKISLAVAWSMVNLQKKRRSPLPSFEL